ncbi:MAG: TetR/AcrR family transcriptional regulator [Brevundimonas sp.]|uniref:TetR/AcrR family transcriptional regulator n=1 Tax=Brevundimonas albigilva TaxID=1312364 RepID=A0ABY4SRA4_9CAUL|nr:MULTISPECIES: TetR/AcrR family transcriptional regulator [Brevundimonas]PZU58505.1 MAG: TetR/AcrR family transcriptional regulator [Brevundimonas sp.]UQV18313.1 TetR/AcrR family transcriptional regulator [Brevundimonas albigilva]URI16829.1 TetR/AcrR family transcriptional regulator [Brevundimonas albigilva]
MTAANPRSNRKPKGEGHSRRGEILAAAERIFVEHGYEGATIRKIADAVGLSSTALYMHFADKGEILQEICREAFARLIEATRDLAETPAPPEVRLRRMIEAYVTFGFDHPNAYRLIYLTRPAEAREGAQTMAQEMGGGLFDSFEAAVAETVRAGRMTGEPTLIAQAIWASAHGVVSLMITKPYFPWAERQALVDTTLDAVFGGLLKS